MSTRLWLWWLAIYSPIWNAYHRLELRITGRCSCAWCTIGIEKHRVRS